MLWDDDVIVDTGFNACIAIPESCCSGVPICGWGQINQEPVPLSLVALTLAGTTHTVPAGRVQRDQPIVGIRFLELFQISLWVQKAPGEDHTTAFLASNDEQVVRDAFRLYWDQPQQSG